MPSLAQTEEQARIARILSRLDDEDRTWLEDRLAPPWQRQARRLAARAAKMRNFALAYYPLESGRAMAAAITLALSRYCAGGFRFEADLPIPGDPRRAALWQILHLNKRRSPSESTVRRELAGVGQKKLRKLATAHGKRGSRSCREGARCSQS